MTISLKKRESKNVITGNKIVFILLGLNGPISHFSYELSQIASLSTKKIDIVLVDSKKVLKEDLVCEKFIHADIGLSKSEVTQQRCSSAFDLNIDVLDEKIDSKEELLNILAERMGYYPIVISDGSALNTAYSKYLFEKVADITTLNVSLVNNMPTIDLRLKNSGTQQIGSKYCLVSDDYIPNNKKINVELSKILFLYTDDILCDRGVTTWRTSYNDRTKSNISTYINNDMTISPSEENYVDFIKPNTGNEVLIILIGVGGTGASVAYDIAHKSSILDKKIKLIFIDGDIVEAKNLNRQRFILQDLGDFKAKVTAERCSKAYNIDVEHRCEYIEDTNYIHEILTSNKDYYPIILGCSDSLKLRHLVCLAIKEFVEKEDTSKNIVYIDAGNDENAGQVLCTYVENNKYITPDFFDEFPNDLEDIANAKLVTQMSCDELMSSAPQTKGANISAATGVFSYLDDILSSNKIFTYITQFSNKNKIQISKKITCK